MHRLGVSMFWAVLEHSGHVCDAAGWLASPLAIKLPVLSTLVTYLPVICGRVVTLVFEALVTIHRSCPVDGRLDGWSAALSSN